MKSMQEYKKQLESTKPINNFIEKLFEARNQTHLFHFKTKSFSEHKALGHYYEELTDMIDLFTETYQGQYGLLNLTITTSNASNEPKDYLKEIAAFIQNEKAAIKDSHLLNIVDEITTLTYQTIYKLENLH